MIRAAVIAAAALAPTGCGPAFTGSPAAPPATPDTPAAEQPLFTESGVLRIERNPYASRPARRADHDVNATLIADDVALVVEPAIGAPIYVSNQLGAALVRRFGGHLPMKEALAAEQLFLIRPVVSADAATLTGALVVDWVIRDEDGEVAGAVYAKRRLSGAVAGADPWTAFVAADAEHIAIQTAAHLLEEPNIRAAIANATDIAVLDRTPTPPARPASVETGGPPAPQKSPRPKQRP